MKKLLVLFSLFLASSANAASTTITAPNLNQNVTGTSLGGGHYGLDISGTINASNPSVSTTGTAVPASATFMGVQSGANLVGLAYGQALMAASLPVTISSNQSALAVTVASLPLPTGAATSANQATEITSLGTIATNSGTQATAANQTTGNTSLATIATNSGTQATAANQTSGNTSLSTIATNTTNAATTTLQTTGNTSLASILANQTNGTQVVAATPDTAVTGAAAQTATVNNILTVASGAAATSLSGIKSVSVEVNSTGTSGAYIFEGSNDNSTFVAIPVYNQLVLTGTPITAAVTVTASTTIYTFPATTNFVRLRISTVVAGGSIQAFTRYGSSAWIPPVLQVAQNTAANLLVSATEGTAAAVASAWPVKITDGTSTAAVKAASTAAVAADPAQVVALSPNNNTLANALITKLSDGTNTAAVKAASTAPLATDPAVVIAISPNSGLTLTPPVTGSGSAAAATVSTVITATAPANATGFILMNLDTSTANIRWAVGRTATTTLGQQLQPGRDSGFVPIGANVSIVAESGTQNYDIQWVAK